MELLALSEVLKLIETNNHLSAEDNIDYIEIINMLNNGNLHYNAILDDCRSKLERPRALVLHYFRV